MSDPQTVRVLIVDDSVVVRRIVTDVLSSDPQIAVVGTAPNGRIALNKLAQAVPDLVVLDIEMPELDGLGTLTEIRRKWPKLPVIMFSSLTRRGAVATLDALALGASDYVTKPERVSSTAQAAQIVRDQLVTKIKALGTSSHGRRTSFPTAKPVRSPVLTKPRLPEGPPARVEVVVIATSTGGPNALAELVPALPADLPVSVLIVQHMPPVFTALLAERLDSRSALRVHEASHGVPVVPGEAWIAPGNYHMGVVRQGGVPRIELLQTPPENSCRPAADVLFRTAVSVFGPGVLGVVMTGMGQDGLRGCQAIRDAGGYVIVQDEASSVVWGMPGFVENAGLADRVLPLSGLAQAITIRARNLTSAANLARA